MLCIESKSANVIHNIDNHHQTATQETRIQKFHFTTFVILILGYSTALQVLILNIVHFIALFIILEIKNPI